MKKRYFEDKRRISKCRLIFSIFVLLWISVLDVLILNKINENLEFYDHITGNVVRSFDSRYERDVSIMILFDILIAGSFTVSYISWEDKRKRLMKK